MSVASIPSVASVPNVASIPGAVNVSNVVNFEKLDTNYVMSESISKAHQYSLVFDDSYVGNTQDCIIQVKSRREIELLLLSLGKEASVIMDESVRKQHPDVCDWLYGRTYEEIFANLKWSYREEDEVVDIIEKIPLPTSLSASHVQVNSTESEPELIDPEYVHKTHRQNILISKPYQCGNIFYFSGFQKSEEFHIDHLSDHLEGIIIFEAARQAGNASAHLAGMPFGGVNVILKTLNRYSKFVECLDPYIIRTIPAYKQRGGVGFCVYNIIQNGKSCASGYFQAIAYNNKHTYAKFRNSKLVEQASSEKSGDM
jgi:A-factor biosynthesis repeat.